MTSRFSRSVEFKSKTAGRFDSCPDFDRFRNLQFAVLKQALIDSLSGSPFYRRESLIWLNSSDGFDCFLELGCADEIKDFMAERGLIIPIFAVNEDSRLPARLPILLGREESNNEL